MARSLRITSPEAIHHVISRCNNEDFLFSRGHDFQKYLDIIAKYKRLYDFKLFNYNLLHNHVHLLVQVGVKGTISEIMQKINGDFAGWYNRWYNRKGHFWQGRFKSPLINDERYFLTCSIYIDLNSVRAGIVKNPREWKYSSVCVYTEGSKNALVDLSPVYLSLGRNDEERRKEYSGLLFTELERTRAIHRALDREEKKEVRRLLKDLPYGPIPFKRRITELFGRSIGNFVKSVKRV